MKPSICRMVVVKGIQSNGSDEHPAVVNCVHGSAGDSECGEYWCANLTVFPDCGTPRSATSIYVFEDRAKAVKYQERVQPVGAGATPFIVAFWPERA